MKTIAFDVNDKYEINKSKFYTYLYKINDKDEVLEKLDILKKKYKDATHHCYAYICGSEKRFSDDAEPGGTAGMPILNVLDKNDLNYVLCVVVRYFGGIKLGAGGLVRAYTNSVVSCLNKAEIKDLTESYLISINFNYDNIRVIDNLLSKCLIKNKSFNETITYEFIISKDEYIALENNLKDKTNSIEIKDEILV